MELTDQDIQEFMEAWKADFREDIPPAQARTKALQLLDFFATLDLVATGNYPQESDEPPVIKAS